MVIAISALRFGMIGKRFALENIGFQNPLVLRPIDDKVRRRKWKQAARFEGAQPHAQKPRNLKLAPGPGWKEVCLTPTESSPPLANCPMFLSFTRQRA